MGEEQRIARADQRNLAQLAAEIANLRSELNSQVGLLGDTILTHCSVLDRLDNSMTDGQGRGANVPLTPFHGNRNEDFSQYIKQFELINNANNYAAEKRAQILASYLRDKAFFIYDSLPDATKTDYDALKRALCEKFQTADYRRYAHQTFQERKQLATETVPDYACEVHKLGLAALAAIDADQRDALIREKFIAGLLPHLRELIVYSNPASFHEAMTLAERLESLQASRTDNAAKNVMLLESISDRLASLEVHATKGSSVDPEVMYVMEAPTRKNDDGFAIQRKFQPGNFRQDFTPNGIVCYRCNRTGHMARNCDQMRNMNTVACRLCNRMGHFARDCQRRGASLGQRPVMDDTRQMVGNVPRTRPPMRIGRPNQTMAIAVTDGNPEQPTVNPIEYVRWQPLSAAMWVEEPRVSRKRPYYMEEGDIQDIGIDEAEESELTTRTGEISDEAELADDGFDEASETVTGDETDRAVYPVEGVDFVKPVDPPHTLVEDMIAQPIDNELVPREANITSRMQRFVGVTKSCLACLFCWWLVLTTDVVVGREANYRHSAPMLCRAVDGRAQWKLPTTFNCPEGNHSLARTVSPMKFRLYKRNYIQYKSDAWKCVRVTEEVKTFTHCFGDENIKTRTKYKESVSAEECISMKHYKTCNNQPMIFQGGIFQTNNKLNRYYPGGGVNCCHWKQFKVSNCFLYQTHVCKRHGVKEIKELQHNAGPVIDMKATIFNEIVIYNWEKVQIHISINGIIGGLDRQRAILKHIPIMDQYADPHEAAQQAVSHIMHVGYFGFLHGLATNVFQVWSFLIGLYVTVCMVILHCIPIRATLAAWNAGNAAERLRKLYHRWRQRKRFVSHEDLQPQPETRPWDDPQTEGLNRLTASFSDRVNRRYRQSTSDIEIVSPSAAIMEYGLSRPFVTIKRSNQRPRSVDIQPFRVNVIYPVSEVAIPVSVEGLVVECLIDTGASRTLMSTSLSKALGLQLTEATECMRSLTGHELSLAGKTQITAQVAGLTLQGKVFVMDRLQYEFLMGTGFLKQMGNVVMNFASRFTYINGFEIAMKPLDEDRFPLPLNAEMSLSTASFPTVQRLLTNFRIKPKKHLICPNPSAGKIRLSQPSMATTYIESSQRAPDPSRCRDRFRFHGENRGGGLAENQKTPHML